MYEREGIARVLIEQVHRLAATQLQLVSESNQLEARARSSSAASGPIKLHTTTTTTNSGELGEKVDPFNAAQRATERNSLAAAQTKNQVVNWLVEHALVNHSILLHVHTFLCMYM